MISTNIDKTIKAWITTLHLSNDKVELITNSNYIVKWAHVNRTIFLQYMYIWQLLILARMLLGFLLVLGSFLTMMCLFTSRVGIPGPMCLTGKLVCLVPSGVGIGRYILELEGTWPSSEGYPTQKYTLWNVNP